MCAGTSPSNDAHAAATAGFVSPDVVQSQTSTPVGAMSAVNASQIVAAVAVLEDVLNNGVDVAIRVGRWTRLQRRALHRRGSRGRTWVARCGPQPQP